jgi:hypothetical protein
VVTAADYLGSRILAEGSGEPNFQTAAKYMAPARDQTLIGTADSTMAWVIASDGRIRRGDAPSQDAHRDDEWAVLPNISLLVFDPKSVVSHWPQRFTSYKSSLLDGWGRAGHVGAWDSVAQKGFELLAVAPNRTMDAQILIRIGEATCAAAATTRVTTSCGISTYRYFRSGDHGPDLQVVDAYQEPEPDGKRFYQALLTEHERWNGPLFFSDTSMKIRLPYAERRVTDMARASLTMGLTIYRGLVPNYGTGGYWTQWYGAPDGDGNGEINARMPWTPCRLDEGACASLPMQSFAMDNALLEWGLHGPAQARIAFFLRRFVRHDGTINLLNWNSKPTGPARCPFDGPADANDTSLPQFNDGLADYGRTIDMWVRAVELSPAGSTDTFVAQTLPSVLAIGRYILALRRNATTAIPASSVVHGLVFGPAEHDTCPNSDYYINVQVWVWRGLVRLGDWLLAAGGEPALAAELLHDAADFRTQLNAAVAATVTPMAGDQLFVPPILGTSNPALRVPWVNMTQPTPKAAGQSIPSYANFRYYGETLLAAALPPSIEQAISSFREAHGGTLSGMTRYMDHLE